MNDETEHLILRIKSTGWNVGEVGSATCWRVKGTNGENVIHAEGPDPLTAWRRACEQARSVGMLQGE